MSLQTCGHHLYEPLLGIVLFEMREDGDLMVSECALRNRARVDGDADDGVEELFRLYRTEIENIASQQYDCGFKSPVVRALDLAPPPPLPSR